MSFVHPLEWPMKFGTWKFLSIQIFEDLEVEFNYILRYKNQCPNVISESFHIFGVYMIFCCWGLLENDSIPGLNCWDNPPTSVRWKETGNRWSYRFLPKEKSFYRCCLINEPYSWFKTTHNSQLFWMILHEIRKPICNWLNNLLVPSILSTISRWTYTNSQL